MTTLGLTRYDAFAEAAVAARYGREMERAVAAERARCVAVCREVAAQHWATGKGGATECAEAIERGAVGR